VKILLALLLSSLPVFAQTNWYVRPLGGTRFSTNITNGQCNGQADADYPGSGVNQPCAFNDVRLLWQDGTQQFGGNNPGYNWIIAGGDIVTIRGSIADGVTYRIGWDTAAGCGTTPNARGICNDVNDSGMPAPPSGTSAQHTIIRGGNFANCTAQTARTQLHGGFGVDNVINIGVPLRFTSVNFSDSLFLDLVCLDITDFDGGNGGANPDFAKYGIDFALASHDITLQHIRVHGIGNTGILGTPTGPMNATDIQLVGNGGSGWNTDHSDGTTGVGIFNVTNYDISWNGCQEEYPIVDALPYNHCTDDLSGGYGDGFGTASVDSPSPGWQVHFDQGTASYNTQDGLDAKHIRGPGSSMTVTRGLAYGNMGNQYKVGGALPIIQNSLIVGNCGALHTAIPGTPAGYNTQLSNFCRAGNTAVLMELPPGTTSLFEYNTVYSDGNIGLEMDPFDAGPAWAGTELFKYVNNTFLGFFNAGHGSNSNPIYSIAAGGGNSSANIAPLYHAGSQWSNNSYLNAGSWTCPMPGESAAVCADPGLVDETYHVYGFGNMAPSSGASAVVGAGVTIAGIPTDYNGATRPNPPAIGALQLASTPTLVSIAVGATSVAAGGTATPACISTYSDSSSGLCASPVWSSATPAKATVDSSTGLVTGVATGTSLITATIGSVSGSGTATVSAAPSFVRFQGAIMQGRIQ
jgi:hypothetical protein